MPNKHQTPEPFTEGQLQLLADQFRKWGDSVDAARSALQSLGHKELFVFHAPSLRTGGNMLRSFLKELESATAAAAEGRPNTATSRKTRPTRRKLAEEELGQAIAAEAAKKSRRKR